MSHLEEFKIVSDIQHGFRKSYSCEAQLPITLEDLAKNLDHGKQSDIILLDFAKAFDTVRDQRLLTFQAKPLPAYRTQSTSADSCLEGLKIRLCQVSTGTLGKFFLFLKRIFLALMP